ncbi:MAG: hypothetical protein LAT50_14180, partial [Ectothiorhodospiraceae bacterium]|nr:hypothetical protein [Ectothiorhodospiraceae bacterium]
AGRRSGQALQQRIARNRTRARRREYLSVSLTVAGFIASRNRMAHWGSLIGFADIDSSGDS